MSTTNIYKKLYQSGVIKFKLANLEDVDKIFNVAKKILPKRNTSEIYNALYAVRAIILIQIGEHKTLDVYVYKSHHGLYKALLQSIDGISFTVRPDMPYATESEIWSLSKSIDDLFVQ